jgi:hypothetical protein
MAQSATLDRDLGAARSAPIGGVTGSVWLERRLAIWHARALNSRKTILISRPKMHICNSFEAFGLGELPLLPYS